VKARIRPACLTVFMALALAPVAARAEDGFLDLRDMAAIDGDAEAGKAAAAVCMACHGSAGIAPVPMYPSLAGQHAEYLYGQLLQIRHEARADSPMTALVAGLEDAALRDISAWFATLPAAPPPGGSPSSEIETQGERLYLEGDPDRGVPPCQGCHGAEGGGFALAADTSRWRLIPILRGQHAAYLGQRLRDYRDGKHTASSSARVMAPIAATLDDAAIDALAQWLDTNSP
jgi:cytochrome c553